MKRLISALCLFFLCLSLTACGHTRHSFAGGTVISEPCAGMDGKLQQICVECGQTQTVAYPAASLVQNDTFTLTIRQFCNRLNSIGSRMCPGLTVHLIADDYSVATELRYNGEPFCQLTYYDSDDYLQSPFADNPMDESMLDYAVIRHVNLLDYVDAAHAPNSFAAIAMTFDPMLTEAEALELADFLKSTRQEYYGNYLVTSINDIGYGHAYPVNQMINSGSIAIHAGGGTPNSCIHTPDYEFSGDGVPGGYCTKCGDYVSPAGNGWTYLTNMKVVSHSNNSSQGKDIQAGNWDDPVGAMYWGALKFWVIDHPGWSNTEYIEYSLDQHYSTLSGTIVAGSESDPDAVMWIEIYLDGNLAYSSENIGYYSYVPYMLDIRGVSNIRISCSTNTDAQGYCVTTAAVF